jgi:inorganic pyrophosphatase
MPNLAKLPTWAGDDLVHVVVETPRGARAKLNFDPELRAFVLSKALMLGLSYPYDWGFIPSTKAEDGDPLDAMVIHDAATYPGLIMRCKLIAVLQTLQQTKRESIRNDRIIAVPENSHRERGIAWSREHFTRGQGRAGEVLRRDGRVGSQTLKFLGWKGPAEAKKLIRRSEKAFKKEKV